MDTTTQDLVTRLRTYEPALDEWHEANGDEIRAAIMVPVANGEWVRVQDVRDALAAAPPADLVALVRDMREALEAISSPGAIADYGWWTETARRVLRDHPIPAWRPSAPPEPAALPCGCARGHCEASTPAECAVIQASAREAL